MQLLLWFAWMGISNKNDTSLAAIPSGFFTFLEQKFGEAIIKFIFSLLIAARNGLNATTMLQLIKQSNHLPTSTTHTIERFWAHFTWLLSRGPILLQTNQHIRFMDKHLQLIASNRYTNEIANAYKVLHAFYTTQPDEFTDGNEHRSLNEPKFNELPYHAFIVDQTSFLQSTYLTDLRWIQHKLTATKFVQTILNDIYLLDAATRNTTQHIRVLIEFIERYLHALNYDAGQFYPLLKHYLNELNVESDVCKQWQHECNAITITYLDIRASPINVNDATPYGYDLITNLGGYFVASMNTKREEICVWNIAK